MNLPQFQRTICACEACKVGCRTMPGMCGIGDVERIIDHVAKQRPELFRNYFSRENFIRTHFVAGDGAKVGVIREGKMQMFNIPTITPRQRPNGECVFYDNGLCSIHEVSPAGCALVDTHMDREQTNEIVGAKLREIMRDRSYLSLWQWLQDKGAITRPTAKRRAHFEREYAKVLASQESPKSV